MFCFHLSSSCWACFSCLSGSLSLLSPNLFDYFILLFTPLASLHFLPLWPSLAFPIFMFFSSLPLCLFFLFFSSLSLSISLYHLSLLTGSLIVFCLITLASLLGFKAFVLYSFHPLHSVFLSSCLFSVISLICSWCFLFLPSSLCPLMPLTLDPSWESRGGRSCSAPS